MMMAAIHLHGWLAEKYGARFDLAVHSVGEAIRLLDANFRGFSADLMRHTPGFFVRMDGRQVTDLAAARESAIAPEIHIVPAIAGAGGDNNGLGKIIMAAVLIVASYYGGFSADTSAMLMNTGVSLAISGVSDLLFSNTSRKTDDASDLTGETSSPSYAFNGPVNTTAQGNPVPILYGRLRIGSQVVSAGITTA